MTCYGISSFSPLGDTVCKVNIQYAALCFCYEFHQCYVLSLAPLQSPGTWMKGCHAWSDWNILLLGNLHHFSSGSSSLVMSHQRRINHKGADHVDDMRSGTCDDINTFSQCELPLCSSSPVSPFKLTQLWLIREEDTTPSLCRCFSLTLVIPWLHVDLGYDFTLTCNSLKS